MTEVLAPAHTRPPTSQQGGRTTGHRTWPWERPFDELEHAEALELHMLRHIIENQRALGRMLVALAEQQEIDTVALIDDITAAAEQTEQAAVDAANRVIATINENNAVVAGLQADLAAADQTIADLQAQIDAGTVTPEAAQAVLDTLTATKTTLDGIDAAEVPAIG